MIASDLWNNFNILCMLFIYSVLILIILFNRYQQQQQQQQHQSVNYDPRYGYAQQAQEYDRRSHHTGSRSNTPSADRTGALVKLRKKFKLYKRLKIKFAHDLVHVANRAILENHS